MENLDHRKWYFKTWPLVIAFLGVGPFMLPLVWANPYSSKKSKIMITIIVLILSYVIFVFTSKALKNILNFYQMGVE